MSRLPVGRNTARATGSHVRASRFTKRHVMLLALLPLLVAVWIPVMTGGRRTAPVPPPSATAHAVPPPLDPATSAAGPTDPTDPNDPTDPTQPPAAPAFEIALALPMHSVVAEAGTLTHRLLALTTPFEPDWDIAAGDPFTLETQAAMRTVPTPSGLSAPTLVLEGRHDPALEPTAVLISAGQAPMAIIGGRAYRPGDEVAGHRIRSIEERRVVFARGDTSFSVSIPAPTIGQEQDHD